MVMPDMVLPHLRVLLFDMERLLVSYTRITPERYQAITFLINNHNSTGHLQVVYDLLSDFRANEYAELHKIFRLPLDAHEDDENGHTLWGRYFKNKQYQLTEMRMFRSQAKKCLEKWLEIKRKCNEIKKSHDHANSKNSEGVSAKSE